MHTQSFIVFDLLTPSQGVAPNYTALTPSRHVLIVTPRFGEFLPQSLGDSVTDGGDYNIPTHSPVFCFFKKHGEYKYNKTTSQTHLHTFLPSESTSPEINVGGRRNHETTNLPTCRFDGYHAKGVAAAGSN